MTPLRVVPGRSSSAGFFTKNTGALETPSIKTGYKGRDKLLLLVARHWLLLLLVAGCWSLMAARLALLEAAKGWHGLLRHALPIRTLNASRTTRRAGLP